MIPFSTGQKRIPETVSSASRKIDLNSKTGEDTSKFSENVYGNQLHFARERVINYQSSLSLNRLKKQNAHDSFNKKLIDKDASINYVTTNTSPFNRSRIELVKSNMTSGKSTAIGSKRVKSKL